MRRAAAIVCQCWLAFAAATSAESVAAASSSSKSVVTASFGAGGVLVAEVASASSFRLGVRFDGWAPAALPSISLEPSAPAASTPVSWGGLSGLQTAFGALLVATDGSGAWVLYDSANNTLVSSGGPPTQNAGSATLDAGIALPVLGTAAALGPSRDSNCLGNGFFGPPFYYNRAGGYLAFVTPSWAYDPLHPHCAPVDYAGNVGGSRAPDVVAAAGDTCQPQRAGMDAQDPMRSAGFPNGLQNASTAAECCAACNSDPTCTSWVWSDGSSPDPAGDCWPLASFGAPVAKAGRVLGGSGPPPPVSAWWGMGGAVDVYLAPAASPLAYYRALYELTSPPSMPPRYAFGFSCTYWGYSNMEEVEGNMTAFRDGAYPVDSFIMDYDWWNPTEKYVPDNTTNLDFAYDPIMFGPHTFVHPPGSAVPNATTDGPVQLFDHFHTDINMRFGGIRKPRTYSNADFCNASGWLLPPNFEVGAGGDNWNMSIAAWGQWWAPRSEHFISEGLDYWWNDEGETQWFTYSLWNAVQALTQAAVAPLKRFWSINRSFQPGMQRNAAVSWTGDAQDCSHTKVLTFVTAGQLYAACDMTAPSATVLLRQYQNAVFLPIMRVHAMHGTPRFPFFWGAGHEAGFRRALELRYHFLPHLYSLAHAARARLMPIGMPASYVFPDTADFPASVGDGVYIVGDSLLPAVVSTANRPDPAENTTTSTLPPGVWYAFNTTAALIGPQVVTYVDVPLTTNVVFVRAGAILALQRDIVQFSSAIGGVLELHVYAGRDGAFDLVEDDGETTAYASAPATATRVTSFAWADAARTLSWTVAGTYSGPQTYTMAAPVLFTANASAPSYHAPVALGASDSITF